MDAAHAQLSHFALQPSIQHKKAQKTENLLGDCSRSWNWYFLSPVEKIIHLSLERVVWRQICLAPKICRESMNFLLFFLFKLCHSLFTNSWHNDCEVACYVNFFLTEAQQLSVAISLLMKFEISISVEQKGQRTERRAQKQTKLTKTKKTKSKKPIFSVSGVTLSSHFYKPVINRRMVLWIVYIYPDRKGPIVFLRRLHFLIAGRRNIDICNWNKVSDKRKRYDKHPTWL